VQMPNHRAGRSIILQVHAQQSPSRPTAYDMSISAVCVKSKCKALWLGLGLSVSVSVSVPRKARG